MSDKELAALMQNADIIRNLKKIAATRQNARVFLEIKKNLEPLLNMRGVLSTINNCT